MAAHQNRFPARFLARFPASSSALRLLSLAAAAAVTLALLSGLVSLADDQPMAIAGQGTQQRLAQKNQAVDKKLALEQAHKPDQTAAN